MKQINIREALLELDRKTDARYDLTTLYEACKLDDEDKQQLVKYIDAYDHPATINKFLSSKCDAITEALDDDDVSDMKIIDEINDGGDQTLWSLMNKFEDEDLQLKDLTEDVDPEVLQGRLDNIDYVMNHYVKDSFLIDDVQGSGKDWKVTYNDVTVDVNFDTDWEEYTYYINGKGPYAHSSYEYIASDVANFVDYNHLGQSDDEVDEALGDNRDVHTRTHMDSYDVYCTDCGQVTSHKFKGNFKDGEKELGRYICKECGCENDDDPINESLTEGALDENPIIAWLGEHEQAWEDFTAHFVGRDISELSDDEIIGWISEHDQLYADYKNYFKVDECLNEGVDTSNLEPQIKEVVTAVMQENGYEADEIEAYTAVEIKDTVDDMVQVEVRAELGYDDLMELCNKLNPIVAALDPHAYFEPVTTGIARAFIRKDQSEDIVDEEAVNQWTNKIYDCASIDDLRQVYAAFQDHVDNNQYNSGTASAIADIILKKADMLDESLTEGYNKGDWVEVNLNTKKNGTPNIIPVKVDKELYHGRTFLGWAWGERQHEYPMSAIVKKIDMDDTDAIIRKYTPSGYMNESKLTLNESDDTDILYDMEDYDEDNTTVTAGNSFIEDGHTWTWFRQCGDTVHLDFDNWAVWWAYRPEVEDDYNSTAISGFFVVDTDTGFIDWGPCDTVEEAQQFLQSKVDDYNMDEAIEPEKVFDKDGSEIEPPLGRCKCGKALVAGEGEEPHCPKCGNSISESSNTVDESVNPTDLGEDEFKPVKESYRQDTPDNVYKVGDRVAQRWTDEFNVGTVTDIKEEEGTQYKVEWDYSEGPSVEWLYGTDISLWIEEDNIDESKSIKESNTTDLNSTELSAAEYALDLLSRRPDVSVEDAVSEGCTTYNYAYLDYDDEYIDSPEADFNKVLKYVEIKRNKTESKSIKENVDSNLESVANKLFNSLKEYGANKITKNVDVYQIYFNNSEDDSDATLVHYDIQSEGFKEVTQHGDEPNVTEYVNEDGTVCAKLLIYADAITVEVSAEDASQYMESVDKDLTHCTECGKKLNDKGYCETEGCPNGTLKEGVEKYIIIAKEGGLNLYYNATDDNFGTDMKAATQYEERAVALDDYKAVKERYPNAYIRSMYDLPLVNKPSKKEGFEEDEWDDDELASIYGGDTKNDMPDGVETPEETEARLAKEAKGNEI